MSETIGQKLGLGLILWWNIPIRLIAVLSHVGGAPVSSRLKLRHSFFAIGLLVLLAYQNLIALNIS